MKPFVLQVLEYLLVGPIFALLVFGIASTVILTCCVTSNFDRGIEMLKASALEFQRAPVLSSLRGLATLLLLLFFSFGILFRQHALALLGIIVVVACLTAFAIGALVVSLIIGESYCSGLNIEADFKQTLRSGFLLLSASTIVPIAGWIVVIAAVFGGTGAFIKTAFTKTAPQE